MDIIAEITDRVVNLDGDFDASAFCRVLELIRAEPSARVVIDFHRVRCCQPFVLFQLFDLIGHSGGTVRVRGLCQQHYALVGYIGGGSDTASPPLRLEALSPRV